MNKFQKKVEDVMDSIEGSNSFKCQTRVTIQLLNNLNLCDSINSSKKPFYYN